jgi:hypothetical protein
LALDDVHAYLRRGGTQVRVVGEDEELGRHCFAEADPATKTVRRTSYQR